MNDASRVKIAPSLLSADFSNLRDQIRKAERGGADWLHLDIMDGSFVPNISFGPMVVRTVRSLTRLPLDTHLMIDEPDRYLKDFREAGATRLTVHVEAGRHVARTLREIRTLGMKAGITLNPSTPLVAVSECLPFVDLLLIMTVNPGFGGQKFIPSMVSKIERAAAMIKGTGLKIHLEVDGGVDGSNAAAIVRAGAGVLVAGNSVFAKRDIAGAIRALRSAAAGRKGSR